MKNHWWIPAICLCLIGTCAFAAPKVKHKKGNPEDQPALNLNAGFVQDSEMHVDGNLSEWGEGGITFQTLLGGEYDYDWTGPKDLSAKAQAYYGAEKIYFVVSVTDQAIVNKLRQWKSDKVELWLAPEDNKGKALAKPRGIELDIGPMVDGGRAGVRWLSGKQGGVEAIGFVGADSYDFEISVEYAALSKQTPVLNGAMRFCFLVRDWDQDDANEDEASIGSCPINPKKASSIAPAKMGKIQMNLSEAVWSSLAASGAFASAKGDWNKQVIDLSGTDFPEIVGVSDNMVVIAGFGLGTPDLSYYSIEIQPSGSFEAPKVEIKDINGDKKKEIILTRKEACLNDNMGATRTYVFSFDGGLALMTNYMNEQHTSDNSKSVKNSYKFNKKGLVQTLDKGSSPDMPVCQLNGDDDMIPILMPEYNEKSRNVDIIY